MAKVTLKNPSYSENLPKWYWVMGLHDACIINVETFEFPFDYTKYNGEKNARNRNLFVVKIDSSGALYETGIKEIKFFNYKVLTNDIDLQGRKKVWWLSDRLTEKDGHFYLDIDLQDFDSFPEEFTWKIKFERAEVIRK